MLKIHCKYDELVPIAKLKTLFNEKNTNKHSKEQIERFSKVMAYQGIRWPANVSKLSGKIQAGHGRILCAELLGEETYPVVYQEYDDETMEVADLTSDNAISEWSELDLSLVNSQMLDLGPDFDVDLFGIKDFEIEPAEKESKPKVPKDKSMIQCPNCEYEFEQGES